MCRCDRMMNQRHLSARPPHNNLTGYRNRSLRCAKMQGRVIRIQLAHPIDLLRLKFKLRHMLLRPETRSDSQRTIPERLRRDILSLPEVNDSDASARMPSRGIGMPRAMRTFRKGPRTTGSLYRKNRKSRLCVGVVRFH